MIDEVISGYYIPKNSDDWVLIQTQIGNIYSLRLGGYKKEEKSKINYNTYNLFQNGNYINFALKEVLTDNEWMYIILENNLIVASGWVSIDNEGEPSLGIKFTSLSDYENNFFNKDFYNLSNDEYGNSI